MSTEGEMRRKEEEDRELKRLPRKTEKEGEVERSQRNQDPSTNLGVTRGYVARHAAIKQLMRKSGTPKAITAQKKRNLRILVVVIN